MEWKRKFIDLLEQDNWDEADSLKYSHFPKRFYKYQTLNEQTLHNLSTSIVYLRPADELNDPYECYHCIDLIESMRHHFRQPNFQARFKLETKKDISTEEVEALVTNRNPMHAYIDICNRKGVNLGVNADVVVRNKEIEICKFIDERRKKVGISCFTTRSDSMLMWSHYASQHQGVCVEYDFSDNAHAKQLILPVYYTEKRYDITKRVIPLTNSVNISVGEFIGSLHKALDWQYEDEWRLITNKSNKLFKVPRPSAIYLGIRFGFASQDLRQKLTEFATSRQIPLIPMALHPSNYAIVPSQSNVEYYLRP